MRLRTIIVLALAIICGGSAATGVVLMQGRIPNDQEMVSIAVATSDITRGELVTKQVVTTQNWPRRLVPQAAATDLDMIVGRTALVPITKGEPVIMPRLADGGAGRGLAALIPDGQRAYTIQTSRIASNVAGFVMPGNRVDVLLTLRGGRDDDTGGGSSTTLLQAVEILAVDGLLDAPSEHHVDPQQLRSVTLLVTPDQASLLDLGQNTGTLTLSLRNPEDIAESDTTPATVNLLRYTQREPMFAADGTLLTQFADSGDNDSARVTMRPTVPEVDPGMMSVGNKTLPELPPIQAIQTFRGRYAGRILVRSDR